MTIENINEKYSHVFRKKTLCEMVRLSSAIMGIEFAYAAETAFVAPILLELGLDHSKMTVVWALSPILGFLLSPLLGAWSDKCKSSLGRRRPFILTMIIILVLGLMLTPYSKDIGAYFGDKPVKHAKNFTLDDDLFGFDFEIESIDTRLPIIAIIITIIGTILMDFNADVVQAPLRTYLIEICVPEDHGRGLSMFTLTAGIGACLGFSLGAVNWDNTNIANWIGGNIKFIFLMAVLYLIVSTAVTMFGFSEIPLDVLEELEKSPQNNKDANTNDSNVESAPVHGHGGGELSVLEFAKSIIFLPKCMKILYLTNLMAFISLLSYALYFTDFVGECVFGGKPAAYNDPIELEYYNDGVRFGCWGLAVYALSCTFYSLIINRLIKMFKLKVVFVGSILTYSIGMFLMVILKSKLAVLLLSTTSGVIYTAIFNIPYLLVAHYHSKEFLESNAQNNGGDQEKRIGLGTDLAIINTTLFMAQIILSFGLSALMNVLNSATVIIWTGAITSLIAALLALLVTYHNL